MATPAHASTPSLQREAVPRTLHLTESAVALTAVAVTGLHVADDSFFQPEPGTTALDHLPGGLLVLAALGGAAVAYRRSRAGVRATVALVVGLLAVVMGAASAGFTTVTVGPSGDDYTGLLLLPAGLTLVGIGVVTLWRSRRLDDSRRRRYTRRGLIGIAALAVLNFVLFPLGFSYVITHVMRQTVPEATLGAPHENVSFRTSDGLELKGWYVPSRNGAAVIAFPGRSGPRAHTRMLVRHGYGVLLFDRRGEGASEGDPNVFGWKGDRDL